MDIRASGGTYQLGRFTLEPRRQLLCDGHPVPLGGKALALLSALAGAGGDLVTKDELMAAVWPGIVVEENAIQVHISAARKALAEEAGRLVTVHGRGYRLKLDGGSVSVVRKPHARRRLRVAGAFAVGGIGLLLLSQPQLLSQGRDAALGGLADRIPQSPQSLEADRLHASAVKLFRERTRPAYADAERLLRRAVAVDPKHAPSWARLAMVVYSPSWWSEQDHPGARARLYSEAMGYAQRALAIDPRLAEAHQAVGFIMFDRDPLPWFERAAALDPNDPEIADQLAQALMARLEMRRALAQSARAFALDPTNARFADNYAYLLRRLGHRAEAYRLIDNLERTTTRGSQARQIRFRFAFGEGRLADASAQAAHALAIGDDERWWPRETIYQSAVILDAGAVAKRLLQTEPQMAVTVCYYQDPSRALRLARMAPTEWWGDIMPGALARQLVQAGRADLLLALFDNRYTSVAAFWSDNREHNDSLAPPLILAMRAAGRESEAAELRNHFAADVDKLAAEGDASLRVPLWRAYLAALDGRAELAAIWIDRAVAAGWKTQDAGLGLAPDRDPVFAAVRDTARFRASIARFHAAIETEAVKFRRLDLVRMPLVPART